MAPANLPDWIKVPDHLDPTLVSENDAGELTAAATAASPDRSVTPLLSSAMLDDLHFEERETIQIDLPTGPYPSAQGSTPPSRLQRLRSFVRRALGRVSPGPPLDGPSDLHATEASVTVLLTRELDGAAALAQIGDELIWLEQDEVERVSELSTAGSDTSDSSQSEVRFRFPATTFADEPGGVGTTSTARYAARVLVWIFRFATARDGADLSKQEDDQFGLTPGLLKVDETGGLSAYPGPSTDDHHAKFLLLVHGTMSNTANTFADLLTNTGSSSLLTQLHSHYNLILGFDHRTITASPEENAIELARLLEEVPLETIDIICFSRGSLIVRELCKISSENEPEIPINQVVHLGSAAFGTPLAAETNWRQLASTLTTLATIGAGLAPGAPAVWITLRAVGFLVRGIGIRFFGRAPGLLAMDPENAMVTDEARIFSVGTHIFYTVNSLCDAGRRRGPLSVLCRRYGSEASLSQSLKWSDFVVPACPVSGQARTNLLSANNIRLIGENRPAQHHFTYFGDTTACSWIAHGLLGGTKPKVESPTCP